MTVYATTQVIGRVLIDRLLRSDQLNTLRVAKDVRHRIFDEPFELWGALILLAAALALWAVHDRKSARGFARQPPR